jgi:3-hydroxyisobutyrate dehydrogenase
MAVTPRRRVGLVGLGIMGSGMAARLVDRDFAVTVWDRDPAACERAAGFDATVAPDLPALARSVDTIVTILWDDAVSRDVVLGRIIPAASPGTTLIEMSTLTSDLQRKLARAAHARGLFFLEAPVTGSKDAARDGKLTAYVGGLCEVLNDQRDVLAALTQRVVHVGSYGSSAVVKLANNQLIALLTVALGESLLMVERAGLDRGMALELFVATCARVPAMKHDKIVERDWTAHFSVDALLKDVRAALHMAQEGGVQLPVLTAAAPFFAAVSEAGNGSLDFSAVVDVIAQR